MTERPKRPERSLQDRIKDAVQGFLDELAGMVRPEPELVPIPVRRPQRPRRGR